MRRASRPNLGLGRLPLPKLIKVMVDGRSLVLARISRPHSNRTFLKDLLLLLRTRMVPCHLSKRVPLPLARHPVRTLRMERQGPSKPLRWLVPRNNVVFRCQSQRVVLVLRRWPSSCHLPRTRASFRFLLTSVRGFSVVSARRRWTKAKFHVRSGTTFSGVVSDELRCSSPMYH